MLRRSIVLGDSTRSTSPHRLKLAVALTVVMTLSTLMQFTMGAMAPSILSDLDITQSQFGVMSAAYFGSAAASCLLVGTIVDRVPAGSVIVTPLVLCGLGYVAFSASPSFVWTFPGLALAGASAACANPATNRALKAYDGRRGTIVAIKQSGVQLGALIAGALLAPFGEMTSWRVVFIACGAAALIAAFGCRHVVPKFQPTSANITGTPHVSGFRTTVTHLMVYAFFMGGGMATVLSYLTLFAHNRLHFDTSKAAMLIAVLGASAILGRMLWSYFAVRRAASIPATMSLLALLAMISAAASAALVAAHTSSAWIIWPASSLFGVSAGAWNAVATLSILTNSPIGQTGRWSARVFVGFFAGLAATPVLFALLLGSSGRYFIAWALTLGMFLGGSVTAFWGAVAVPRTVGARSHTF